MNNDESNLPQTHPEDEEDEDLVLGQLSRASSSRVIYTPSSSDDEDEQNDDTQTESWGDGVGSEPSILSQRTQSARSNRSENEPTRAGFTGHSATPSKITRALPQLNSDFLLAKAQSAFEGGRIPEAATLLQVLIRDNDVKTVDTPARVHMLLADAYVLISRMPELCKDYSRADEAKKRYLANAKMQLEKADESGNPDSLEEVKIHVKLSSLAVVRGDHEEAERLINLAGIRMDKHNSLVAAAQVDGEKAVQTDSPTVKNRKERDAKGRFSAKSMSKYEPMMIPSEHGDLHTEIRTIRAMLLSHEDDGYGFRTQHELGPLVHDASKRRLVGDILSGFGYDLIPDRHMPAKYIICPRNEDTERKRRRQRLFGENYDEQRDEAAYTLSLSFAVLGFAVWFFLFGLNIFRNMLEPGFFTGTAIGMVVLGWWSYLTYLYVSLYGEVQ